MRAVWAGVAGLAALVVPLPAHAHPHIFIDAAIEVVFAPDGRAEGVRLRWSYDDFFSLTLVAERGLDPDFDGVLTPEELAQQDDQVCRSYGMAFGTPEYAQCRQFQQADRTAKYQAYQQRQAAESVARSLQNAAAQKERQKTLNQRCYFTEPDKSGWSKRVCESY